MNSLESADGPTRSYRRRNLILFVVLVIAGLGVLWKVGRWAKARWLDPDRLLLGVHAIDGEEALVVYRYDGDEKMRWRIGRLRIGDDGMAWERDLPDPLFALGNNGVILGDDDVIVLVESSSHTFRIESLDLATGEVRWDARGRQDDGSIVTIAANATHVFIDGRSEGLHVFARASGERVHRDPEYRGFGFAYDDRWLDLGDYPPRYLDLTRAVVSELSPVGSERCVVDGVAYAIDDKDRGLSMQPLAGGDPTLFAANTTEILGTPLAKFAVNSCGWMRLDDALRFVFTTSSSDPNVAMAFDLDADAHTATLAWAIDLGSREPETGRIGYSISNNRDLPWFGAVTRFVPLELRVPRGDETLVQMVMVDLVEGRIVSEGEAFDRPLSAFRHGTTLFVRSSDPYDLGSTGFVVAIDGSTGNVLGSVEQETINIGLMSIAGDAVWLWTGTSFSRADDLAVSVFDRSLDLVSARDPERVPVPAETFAKTLLGDRTDG